MPNGEDNALDEFSQEFPNEVQNNLNEDFPSQNADALDDNSVQQPIENTDVEDVRKNRQHRRTSQRLQSETRALQEIREANIKEAGRLEALSEQRKFLEGTQTQSIDERLITLYGSDENGRKAAQITQSLLEDTAKRARQQALEDFQQSSRDREREIKENNEFIDSQLEALEDESGLDLTSSAPIARKNRAEFLDMVTKFSSKDKNGDVQEYADFNEVFNVFKQTRKSSNNTTNKDLASRGMVRGSSNQQSLTDKTNEKWLLQNGLI